MGAVAGLLVDEDPLLFSAVPFCTPWSWDLRWWTGRLGVVVTAADKVVDEIFEERHRGCETLICRNWKQLGMRMELVWSEIGKEGRKWKWS